MQCIDFLITFSLLNNQGTANALVISIQFTGQGLWKLPFLHSSQGHSFLWYCMLYMIKGHIKVLESKLRVHFNSNETFQLCFALI